MIRLWMAGLNLWFSMKIVLNWFDTQINLSLWSGTKAGLRSVQHEGRLEVRPALDVQFEFVL